MKEQIDYGFRLIMSIIMVALSLVASFNHDYIASAIFWLSVVFWRYL